MLAMSLKTFVDSYSHYDENNNPIGSSTLNPFFAKEYIHSDIKGNVLGYSKPDLGEGYLHYDNNMNFLGKSAKNPLGGYVHYLENGDIAGTSLFDFFGNLIHKEIKVCIFKE